MSSNDFMSGCIFIQKSQGTNFILNNLLPEVGLNRPPCCKQKEKELFLYKSNIGAKTTPEFSSSQVMEGT